MSMTIEEILSNIERTLAERKQAMRDNREMH